MKKMDVNEKKALDYYNHEEHNRFRHIIEFPTIQCVRFANVLCKDEELVQRYLNEYYNPEFEQWEIINSLIHLKKDLLKERTNVSEYEVKIKECIKIANWKYLWLLLQDLYLEYLSKEQLQDIIELIHKGLDADDIMKWYEKGKKILAITTFGVDYIKTVTKDGV